MRRVVATVLLLVLAVLLEGCWFRRSRKSPPPPPKAVADPAPSGTATPASPTTTPKGSPGARTPAAVRRTQKPTPRVQPEAKAPAAARTVPPALGQIITEEQRSEYRRTYDVDTSAARDVLTGINGRVLTREQMETVSRIKSFLQQAAEATATDWSLAANVARRAALLARDLAEALR